MTGSQTEYIQYRKDRAEEVFLDARLLADNGSWRQKSDYSVIVDFQEEDVLPLIEEVKNLKEVLKQLIDKKLDS